MVCMDFYYHVLYYINYLFILTTFTSMLECKSLEEIEMCQ